MDIEKSTMERARKWLDGNFDPKTKDEIARMMKEDPKELGESFYKTLEFGTGGLRGIMGVGTNRMNIYTVGMATQGLANYLKSQFADRPISVAVAHDSRNNSDLFAKTTADIFAANGFTVYLFEALRPTPELSFAIRHLHCQSGVVITASHNPKEYNGYKAYWEDGAQVVAPHDKNIIEEVGKIESVDQVKWNGGDGKIVTIGEDIDKAYLAKVASVTLSPEAVAKYGDVSIVYTPIHGTGITLVPKALEMCGFKNITVIEEQSTPDGNFPTVVSPNPEEASALKLAIERAEKIGADLVIATDPDADRIGIAVRDDKGQMVLLNGNQTGTILTYYLLTRWKELGKLKGKEFIVKTIVTTELIASIAESFGVEYYDVLTGFKFIAGVIRDNEGKKQYIGGGEESYGYLTGDFVRDKDAVSASVLVAEAMAWAKGQGLSLWQLLEVIYRKYGYYKEGMVYITKQGKEGAEAIAKMMSDMRSNPPKKLGSSAVVTIKDYQLREETDLKSGAKKPIDLPVSNVLQFITEDGSKVSVRPSGTEPKIKFYFGVREPLAEGADIDKADKAANAKIEAIKRDLGI
ncbi:MAG: phospho-sugar mutase [Rikenellaceae bacterium]|nr:phospho-sugar mutase [Rikenellaceae bacterium]